MIRDYLLHNLLSLSNGVLTPLSYSGFIPGWRRYLLVAVYPWLVETRLCGGLSLAGGDTALWRSIPGWLTRRLVEVNPWLAETRVC